MAGIGREFPGYTYPVIMDLPYEHWLGLAMAYDAVAEEIRKQNEELRRRR